MVLAAKDAKTEVDAMLSAGNTGAIGASFLYVGRNQRWNACAWCRHFQRLMVGYDMLDLGATWSTRQSTCTAGQMGSTMLKTVGFKTRVGHWTMYGEASKGDPLRVKPTNVIWRIIDSWLETWKRVILMDGAAGSSGWFYRKRCLENDAWNGFRSWSKLKQRRHWNEGEISTFLLNDRLKPLKQNLGFQMSEERLELGLQAPAVKTHEFSRVMPKPSIARFARDQPC